MYCWLLLQINPSDLIVVQGYISVCIYTIDRYYIKEAADWNMTLLSCYIVLNEKTLQPYKYVRGNKQTRAEGKSNSMSQI